MEQRGKAIVGRSHGKERRTALRKNTIYTIEHYLGLNSGLVFLGKWIKGTGLILQSATSPPIPASNFLQHWKY